MAAVFAAWPFWAVLTLIALVVLDRSLQRATDLIKHITALRGTEPEQRPPILEQLKRAESREASSRVVDPAKALGTAISSAGKHRR